MRIKSIFTLMIVSFISLTLLAQKVDVEQLKGMKIRSIGPAGMSGRVTAIDAVNSDPNVIYAGTASGGLWRSTSGGTAWKPIFDDQPLQSIGAIAIQQSNPDVIWVGTGEGNPRNSHNSGDGIFKSIDGGLTWQFMGLKATKVIHRIIIDEKNPNTVYVAAMGSAWGPNKERGVYKTTDGGETWKNVLYVNDQTGCADLVMDPSNPNKLIAGMWEHWRKPWFFYSGGEGSGLHITHDGGKTWKKKTDKDGLPKGEIGRIGLAIAPSNPDVVYALVEAKKNGLYRSEDGGNKFKQVQAKDIGNRPFYYADIFVDPKNENKLFNLSTYVKISEDGGKTVRTVTSYGKYGIHPDNHAFWIHPDNPDYIIEGNDGGLNISRDGGKTWRFAENIPVAQYYHINYDMEVPYNVYGGMQDNGTWVGPSEVWRSGGIRNGDWQEVYFGDGFDAMPKKGDSRYVYAMSQGGNMGLVDRESGVSQYIKPTHSDPEVELRFNWNAALAQDPFNDCGLYFGSQFVHRSMDCGQSWEVISPDLTTNDPEKQKQDESGGLTIDATRAENFTTIIAIAPSPVDKDVVWVGTDDGNLQLTKDGGKTWTNVIDRLPNCPKGAWIPQIEVSQNNAGEAYVIVNDYRRNNWKPYAYKTTDMGVTWQQIVKQGQVEGHTLAIVQDPKAPNLLFLGTDYGLYFTIDGGKIWNKWTEGFPSTPTRDLKIHPRELDLVIGTFGRAAWILDDIRPLRELAQSKGKILNKEFHLFDAPHTYLHDNRSYDGVRFTGHAMFVGENAPFGAQFSIWAKDKDYKGIEVLEASMGKSKKSKKKKGKVEETVKKEGKKKGKKPSKATFTISDKDGNVVRTFKRTVKTGLNRYGWYLGRKGVRYPSHRKRRPDAGEPRGSEVLPGKYKVVVEYGKHKDSTVVEVILDPKLNVSMEELKAKQAVVDEFYGVVEAATKGFDNLKEAKKTIKQTEGRFVHLEDSVKKDIKKLHKDLTTQIDSLMKLYTMPPGLKGIQRAPTSLNGDLFSASQYINSSLGKPGQNAMNALNRAKINTNKILKGINTFFEKDWKAYREKIESIEFPIFKDIEPVELDGGK